MVHLLAHVQLKLVRVEPEDVAHLRRTSLDHAIERIEETYQQDETHKLEGLRKLMTASDEFSSVRTGNYPRSQHCEAAIFAKLHNEVEKKNQSLSWYIPASLSNMLPALAVRLPP